MAVFDDYPVLAYGITQGNGLKTVTPKEKGVQLRVRRQQGPERRAAEKFNAGLKQPSRRRASTRR